MTEQEYLEEDEYERPRKSAGKRDAEALQDLGKTLIELPAKSLARVPLPEILANAIALYKTLPTREAKRRQLQYIGKIMRGLEADPIKAAVAELEKDSMQQVARFKRFEAMRDKLIELGDEALGDIIARYPEADRQKFRQLARQAKQQRGANTPPVAARQIFQYLKELDEAVRANKLDELE